MGLRSKKWGPKRKNGVYKKWNRAWMGSGVIQMGWYFGKMTPRGSGSFLNRIFGLPRPKNIKKSPHSDLRMIWRLVATFPKVWARGTYSRARSGAISISATVPTDTSWRVVFHVGCPCRNFLRENLRCQILWQRWERVSLSRGRPQQTPQIVAL